MLKIGKKIDSKKIKIKQKNNNMKKFIKWTPVAIALAALFYSVGLGMNGNTDEALYSSHWPVTLLVFYLVIDKINKE